MAQPVVTGVETQTAVGEGQLDLGSILPMILWKFLAVLEAAVIIIAGLFLIRYLRKKLRSMETAHEQQKTAINLLEKITSGFVIVMSITLALKTVGIDMTLLVSVAILGLSYGLQDIIKNYVAGILILFKAPFKIGDIVKIRDFTGRVSNIDFQSTSLETFDKKHITIYNSDVMTQSIVNFSNNTVRRLDLNVTIGYGSDVQKALKVFDDILKSNEKVLKAPRYSITFKNFQEGGVQFSIRFWVQRPCNILKIRTDVAAQISESFDDVSIYVPYTKAIEVEKEEELGQIPASRKIRIEHFYQLPLFADLSANLSPQAQPVPVENGVGNTGAEQAQDEFPDSEEPE